MEINTPENPGYYAVIPAEVRYSKIPANAKLLYGEITALCQKEGFCWASDSYFSELYGVGRQAANRWVKTLERQGFIKIETTRDATGTKRKLYLVGLHGSRKNATRVSQKSDKGVSQKSDTNNTSISNTSNISTIVDRQIAYGKPEINDLFNYWELTTGYPITAQTQKNRNACNNLLRKYSADDIKRLVSLSKQAAQDRYSGVKISDFQDLQSKLNQLLSWHQSNNTTTNRIKVIS